MNTMRTEEDNTVVTLAEILVGLNKSGVRYLLLSGFHRQWRLEQSGEIDLYIPLEDRDTFLELLEKLGFCHRRKPAINRTSTFYILWHPNGLITLDVQFELGFFHKSGLIWKPLKATNEFLDARVCEQGIWRPDNFSCVLLYAANCCWPKQGRLNQDHIKNLKLYLETFKHGCSHIERRLLDSLQTKLESTAPNEFSESIGPLIRSYFERTTIPRYYWYRLREKLVLRRFMWISA